MADRRCLTCNCTLRSGNITDHCWAHRLKNGHLEPRPQPYRRHAEMMAVLEAERKRLADTSKFEPEDEA